MSKHNIVFLTAFSCLVVLLHLFPPSISAAAAPLPVVPKMVTELYLPEEQAACKLAYKVYISLPELESTKLHVGGQIMLDGKKFTRAQAKILADWFNSARWGGDPPTKKLDATEVAQSELMLIFKDDVIEFILQRLNKGIEKKLVIACSPEKAEWVRDGLPLLPHWYATDRWSGGLEPPSPTISELEKKYYLQYGEDFKQRMTNVRRGREELRDLLHALYPIYAELSSAQLRKLHHGNELTIAFQDLSPSRQRALVSTVDNLRLSLNQGFRASLDYGRPRDAVSRHFGITEIQFTSKSSDYRALFGSIPDSNSNLSIPLFKRVFLTIPTPYPFSEGGWSSHTFALALPPQLQQALLRWHREFISWQAEWAGPGGSPKPGAPPFPKFRLE